jgi:hypothetical protein
MQADGRQTTRSGSMLWLARLSCRLGLQHLSADGHCCFFRRRVCAIKPTARCCSCTALQGNMDLAPHLYVLPLELTPFMEVLAALGAQEAFSAAQYTTVLQASNYDSWRGCWLRARLAGKCAEATLLACWATHCANTATVCGCFYCYNGSGQSLGHPLKESSIAHGVVASRKHIQCTSR